MKEKIKQFWDYSIHPITGFKLTASDKYTPNKREENKKNLELKRKFNKE